MSPGSALGDFLRARRERADPASLGLRTVGPRRTPGLRREEVASLAGISVEYLIRLERGRDRNPSPAVVAALAEVLGLDDAGRDHLTALADLRSAPNYADGSPAPEVLELIAEWPQPVIVMNRFMDLLALNRAGAALHSRLGLEAGDNLLRSVFLDPLAHQVYPDYDDIAAESVATLRGLAGHDPEHPRLVSLVGELAIADPLFATLWARGEVVAKTSGHKRIDLPEGRLTLRWDTLTVAAAPGQLVVTYRCVEGTGSAEVLARLVDEPRAVESRDDRGRRRDGANVLSP